MGVNGLIGHVVSWVRAVAVKIWKLFVETGGLRSIKMAALTESFFLTLVKYLSR